MPLSISNLTFGLNINSIIALKTLSAIMQSHTATSPRPNILTHIYVDRIRIPHILTVSHQNTFLVLPIPYEMPSITIIRPKNGSEKATSISILLPRVATRNELVNIFIFL